MAKTKVTDDGVKQLQQSLPQTQIVRDRERGREQERERVQQQTIQHADPDFDVSISHPAYTDKHPTVDGYRITDHKPFSSELLAKYDLLVTATRRPRVAVPNLLSLRRNATAWEK